MPELTQQRLLEPEPTRTVKATPAAGWLGVDPSTKRVSFGYVSSDGTPSWGTRSFVAADGPRRLAFMYAETYLFARDECVRGWPGFVLIEQPSGKTPNPNLVYAVGVIQAAVYAALHSQAQAMNLPIPEVEMVPSATWKKAACGAGNLYKPKRERGAPLPAFEDYPVAVWARENGYTGSSWDECDAMGLAVAARRTVRFV